MTGEKEKLGNQVGSILYKGEKIWIKEVQVFNIK